MKDIQIIDLNFLSQKNAIASFLVASSEGPILIESGPFSTFPHLQKQLSIYGYQASDIKHVFLTHIHLDHAGAAWWFAQHGAQIYVHPKGYRHMNDPSKLIQSAQRIYKDEMDTLWGNIEPIDSTQLTPVSNAETIVIGDTHFQAWHTPGHASHHIAWQVNSSLFSGDVGGVKIKNGPVMPPCPPPDIHIGDWKKSIQLIKQLDIECMHLTHYGLVTNIQQHLSELENRLIKWVNWIKPYYDNKTDSSAIIPIFQQMVKDDLINNQVTNEEHFNQYELANPAWASVAGLLRYWKKHVE